MKTFMDAAFADAVCDVRSRILSEAVLLDETDKDLRSLERFHAGNRMRQIPGYACEECRQRARVIWEAYAKLLEKEIYGSR